MPVINNNKYMLDRPMWEQLSFVFIQEAEPTIDVGTSALWIQKSLDGSITFNLIEN